MKLLVIEDERELSNDIVSFLNCEKYICEQAFNYNEAVSKITIYEYDCILLDLMLPGGNGLDILKLTKKITPQTGVIIISAKDQLSDKIEGLKIGADDYLSKPFHLPELSMRIFALLRRRNFKNSNTLRIPPLCIDLLSKKVSINDKFITLTKSEYELLLFLIENRKRIISKSAIAEHISGDMADMLDDHNFVYSHIKNLKAKLANAGMCDCIKTFYGMGYKWTIEE